MVSKKLCLKLLVSLMLTLTSQAQNIDSSSVDIRSNRTCQLQHPSECIEQFQVMNQSIDTISLYLDGILNALESDSLRY